MFLVHATNDGIIGGAPIELPRRIAANLQHLGIPVCLEVFTEGAHGVGNLIPQRVKHGFPPAKWPELFLEWFWGGVSLVSTCLVGKSRERSNRATTCICFQRFYNRGILATFPCQPEQKTMTLRILQGGVDNQDKDRIVEMADTDDVDGLWNAPKDSEPGDDAVIYVAGHGFFATAVVNSHAELRDDWESNVNTYGVDLTSFKLIDPPVTIAEIREKFPELGWARSPIRHHTPDPHIAECILALVQNRQV